MPSGLILTILTDEKMPNYDRDDECFYYLLDGLKDRLKWNLRVFNSADLSEELTKSAEDADMITLRKKIDEALSKLSILHEEDCTRGDARKAWDWVFKSDGFFDDFDSDSEDDDPSPDSGIAKSTPKKAVEPRGADRFG